MERNPEETPIFISEQALEQANYANQCHTQLARVKRFHSNALALIARGELSNDAGRRRLHEATFAVQLAESDFNKSVEIAALSIIEDSRAEPSLV